MLCIEEEIIGQVRTRGFWSSLSLHIDEWQSIMWLDSATYRFEFAQADIVGL